MHRISNLFLLIILLCTNSFAQINDPKLIAVSGSSFDFNKKVNTAFEFRVEYRHDKGWWKVRPFAGAMVTSDGSSYFFAGGLVNFFIGEHFVITPSFAPGIYFKGTGKDLYFPLEFRSQIEIAYRFKNSARIGASFGHISNASLGPPNPGVEYLAGTIAFPIN
ncbi:MAG TPA: acyloxyacyl hydrolase [Ignavibacteriaceae bacterium]|nr:acyloxyacyl hydrolase [Ignavibacteriaceae bacterium]